MKSRMRGKAKGTLQKINGKTKEVSGMTLRHSEKGKVGWILLWLLGIPIPVLLVLYFLRGCT